MPSHNAIAPALVAEGARMARICNACRYCEGYCAVFPALERRLDFVEGDLTYLANLCHNCGSCYYACQYAPPHEFAVNFPRMLADVREASYRKYAWPTALARLFDRNGVAMSAAAVVTLTLALGLASSFAGPSALFAAYSDTQGSFYALIPHGAMMWTFTAAFAWAIAALGVGVVRFWRDRDATLEVARSASFGDAVGDVLTLKYLGGGADGCTYPDDRPSNVRRVFHHFTFYGFLLCFASTCIATICHYVLREPAPYSLASAPVVLGTLGGIGLIVGPVGLLWLRVLRDPALASSRQNGMDVAFLLLLLLVSASGLFLLAFRETAAMGSLLAFHLATVMALFVTLPYGKFVHAVYRFAALVRYHVERKQPLPDIGAE